MNEDANEGVRTREWRILTWFWNARSEKNGVAALLNFLASGLIALALVNDRWLRIIDGSCRVDADGGDRLGSIGVTWFYRIGRFHKGYDEENKEYIVYEVDGARFIDCLTPAMSDAFYAVIGLCFLALSGSFIAFSLELFGPKRGFLRWLRVNAIFPSLSAVFCGCLIGLSYWISKILEKLQKTSKKHNPEFEFDHILPEVRLSVGFFLVAFSCATSLLAILASLYKSLSQNTRVCGFGPAPGSDMDRLIEPGGSSVRTTGVASVHVGVGGHRKTDSVGTRAAEAASVYENYLMSDFDSSQAQEPVSLLKNNTDDNSSSTLKLLGSSPEKPGEKLALSSILNNETRQSSKSNSSESVGP